MKNISKYFFRGLLICVPIVIILYIVGNLYVFFKNIFPHTHFALIILGIFICFIFIGYLFSNKSAKRFNELIKKQLRKFPAMHIVYTSIEKVLNSPIKKQALLNKPVIFTQPDTGIRQIGFVTNDSLELINLPEYVTVFLPKAFCVDGDTLIVPAKDLVFLDMDGTQAYTIIVSGGLTLPSQKEEV